MEDRNIAAATTITAAVSRSSLVRRRWRCRRLDYGVVETVEEASGLRRRDLDLTVSVLRHRACVKMGHRGGLGRGEEGGER